MAHPLMFHADDPKLVRVRRIALELPGAAEKVSHGRPTFYTGKVFLYYGGSLKVDGEWVQHEECVLMLPDAQEREALRPRPDVFVPGYLGAYGWLGVDLPPLRASWDEIVELVDESYRNTAGPRLVAQLDAPGPSA